MTYAFESTRPAGVVLVFTAVASIALLLNHPADQAHDFAGLLKEEAANRTVNAVVHGGFIFLLAIQLACYAIFSGQLGWNRALPIAALAFFAVGAAAQIASLVVDGLMLPALAAKYAAAAPDRLPFARSLFVLCGTAVQFLMPIGLFFQSAAVIAWGGAFLGGARLAGAAGLALGVLTGVAVVVAFATGMQLLLMLAIVGLAIWALAAGVAMVRSSAA
jgi:hypothetical protein